MQIKVSMTSGDQYTFDLMVESTQEFLNKVRPTEIFQRSVHQVLGKMQTVSLNPAMVEWIEFDTIDYPTQTGFGKAVTIRQLAPDMFKDWVNKQKAVLKAAMESDVNQNVLLAYGKATFVSGNVHYLEIQAKMERNEDRVKYAQKIFDMPGLFIYGQAANLLLVNTRNIAVWQVVPGLKKSMFFAVQGELTSVKNVKPAK